MWISRQFSNWICTAVLPWKCSYVKSIFLCDIWGNKKKSKMYHRSQHAITYFDCSVKKQSTCFGFWKTCQGRKMFVINMPTGNISKLMRHPVTSWCNMVLALARKRSRKEVSFDDALTGYTMPVLGLWALLSTQTESPLRTFVWQLHFYSAPLIK